VAASNGHQALVNRLVLKHSANPRARDAYGSTPIDDAIRHGHMPVVEFLATQPMATDMNSDAYIEQCATTDTSAPDTYAASTPADTSAAGTPPMWGWRLPWHSANHAQPAADDAQAALCSAAHMARAVSAAR
jgi:hypothetical protein